MSAGESGPFGCGLVGDADEVGEHGGGEFRGEAEECGVSGGSGVDAVLDEFGAEALGDQVVSGAAAGEEPGVVVAGRWRC